MTDDPFKAFNESAPPAATPTEKPAKKKKAKKAAKPAAAKPDTPPAKKTRKVRTPRAASIPVSLIPYFAGLKEGELAAVLSIMQLPKKSRARVGAALAKACA